MDTLTTTARAMYSAQGRVDAISKEKVKIEEYLEKSHLSSRAKSRAKRHLIVEYSFKRKKKKETVCFYEDESIVEIIGNVLWQSVEEKERKSVFGRKRVYRK